MDLKGRKIKMFRCHLDPMIGGRAKLAFTTGLEGIEDLTLTPAGVYVKWVNTSPGNDKDFQEHLVPFANVQSIKFEAEEEKKK